jgi:Ni,Fe-hydrogenase III small subunit/NAD-dependent dihydropyrimidine dehydrogenase PreA subunit
MSAFKSLRVRVSQGTQYIKDLRKAVPGGFRGRPAIGGEPCAVGCNACRDACPTEAIRLDPVAIDLGRCVFCDACVEVCPEKKIEFTPEPRMGAAEPGDLVVREGAEEAVRVRASTTFSRLFGRSLKMRQVSAGGCNACELELNAVSNVNFDLQRFGIEWVASPRHADALVLTGPLTRNMKDAVRLAWDAMPEPRFIVAVGACAISGGLYDGAAGVDRDFLKSVGLSLYVPGCPPHPLTFVNAILDLLGIT